MKKKLLLFTTIIALQLIGCNAAVVNSEEILTPTYNILVDFNDIAPETSLENNRYWGYNESGEQTQKFGNSLQFYYCNSDNCIFPGGVYDKSNDDKSMSIFGNSAFLYYNAGFGFYPGEKVVMSVDLANVQEAGINIYQYPCFDGTQVSKPVCPIQQLSLNEASTYGNKTQRVCTDNKWHNYRIVYTIGNGVDKYTTADYYMDNECILSGIEVKKSDGDYTQLTALGQFRFLSTQAGIRYYDNIRFGVNDVSYSVPVVIKDSVYSIDYNNNIIYLPNKDISAEELKKNLFTNAIEIFVYDSDLRDSQNNGYMEDGNVIVLKTVNESKSYTIKRGGIYEFDENFDNCDVGMLENSNFFGNFSTDGASVTVTDNKSCELSVPSTANESANALIQSKSISITDKTVISFDMYNGEIGNGTMKVILRSNTDNTANGFLQLVSLSDGNSVLSETLSENLSKNDFNRFIFVYEQGYFKSYINGVFFSQQRFDDFDFTNCMLRFTYEGEGNGFADNISMYENRSINDDFIVKRVESYKAGDKVNSLHSGENEYCCFVNNVSDIDRDLITFTARYSEGKLKSVEQLESTSVPKYDSTLIKHKLNIKNVSDDYIKSYVWDSVSQKPVSFISASVKEELYSPYNDEILEAFNMYNNSLNIHPRIVSSRKDFEDITALCTTDETANNMKLNIISAADRIVSHDINANRRYDTEEINYYIDYTSGDTDFTEIARRTNDFIYKLAFAHIMTSDVKYLNKLWEIENRICSFKDWCPAQPLDLAILTATAALGYDWCYDSLSVEQREVIEQAIIKNGINEGFKAYERGDWWITQKSSNCNVQCNAGLIIGALSIIDKYPEPASSMLQNCIKSIRYSAKSFYPDGGWEESVSYGTGTLYWLAQCVNTLDCSFGTDYGISGIKGLEKIPEFYNAIDGPVSINDYGDCGECHITDDSLLWVAHLFNSKQLADRVLKNRSASTVPALLWYDPNITGEEELQRDSYFRNIEAFTMRNSWTNDNGLWLSFCGGKSRHVHSHFDCGSFVLDYNGYRWASDFGSDDYGIANYTFDAYRVRAEGHNTLVINPDISSGQLDGTAKVTEYSINTDKPYAILDMSELYLDNAESVKRGFMETDGRNAVVIRDEVQLKENDSDIYWFMHSKANMTVSQDKVVLDQGNKKMIVQFYTNADSMEISIEKPEPLSTSPNPSGQNPNTGYSKIQVHLKGSGELYLTAKIRPHDTKVYEPISNVECLGEWNEK